MDEVPEPKLKWVNRRIGDAEKEGSMRAFEDFLMLRPARKAARRAPAKARATRRTRKARAAPRRTRKAKR
ncbi:MAG TPA: hypothetical protein VGR28_00370 [Candidatus Thermoplasmatota archaeon]|jgi:hypothetical protein|nr:hypothetical protein [Candidatus Thermoplasmatota archaeon]